MDPSSNSGERQQLIDAIVREVLARLRHGNKNNATSTSAASNAPAGQGSGKELIVEEKVVSLSRLRGQLTGVSKLVVRKGAIVTPAVRDLLKEKQITWEVRQGTTAVNKAALTCGIAELKQPAEPIWKALKDAGLVSRQLTGRELKGLAKELAANVQRAGQLSLLITDTPELAACLANRQRGVRAAVAGCAKSMQRALRTLGVNLLVVDPIGKETAALVAIVKEFVSSGGGQVPAEVSDL